MEVEGWPCLSTETMSELAVMRSVGCQAGCSDGRLGHASLGTCWGYDDVQWLVWLALATPMQEGVGPDTALDMDAVARLVNFHVGQRIFCRACDAI